MPGCLRVTRNMTPSISTEVNEEYDDFNKILAGHAFVNQISISKPEGVVATEYDRKKAKAIDILADSAETLHR